MSSNPGRYSDDTLQKLLSKASVDEIESLLKVYRGDNSYLVAPQVLDLPFKLFGSGYFKSLVLVAEKLDLHVTDEKKEGEGDFYYDSKPFDSYENIKVQKATVKIEKKILNKVLEITYERMSETDKKKFNKLQFTNKIVTIEGGKVTKDIKSNKPIKDLRDIIFSEKFNDALSKKNEPSI